MKKLVEKYGSAFLLTIGLTLILMGLAAGVDKWAHQVVRTECGGK
jgi:hypothetical protein